MPRPPVDNKLLPYKDQLGKVPDQDIAAKAKVSRSAVVNYRKRLGISAYEGYKFQAAPAAAPVAVAVAPRKRGRPPKNPVAAPAPAAPAKTTKAVAAVVAAPAKVTAAKPAPKVVAKPAAAPKAAAKPAAADAAFRGRKSKLDPFLPLLGVEADAVVAAKAKVTVENVRAYRVRRGISAAGQTAAPAPVKAVAPKPAAPVAAPKAVAAVVAPAPAPVAPKAAAAAPAASGRTAWLVTLDEKGESRSYAVLANDIAEAAQAAVAGAKGRGNVRAVSKIADLL